MDKIYQQGVTLIEILVSIFVLALGLLGQAVLQTKAINSTFDSSQRSQAMWLAQEIVERMRVNTSGVEQGYYTTAIGKYGKGCKQRIQPTKICSDYSSDNGKTTGVKCSTKELADFDIWELVCGYDNKAKTNINDTLDKLTSEMKCEDANVIDGLACSPGSDINLVVRWKTSFSKKINRKKTSDEKNTGKIELVIRP